MKRTRWNRLLVPTAAMGAIAFGCAHRPPEELALARASYHEAAANPLIQSEAPVPLHEAEQALDRANRAFEEDADRSEVQHLSYLVERRVDIAAEMAQNSLARKETDRLGDERRDELLRARTVEADTAQNDAEVARQQADRARLETALAQGDAARAELATEQARQQTETLAQELEELQAQQTERGLVLTLGDVFFDVGKAELKPGAEQHLRRLADFLTDNPDRELVIEGHTDSTGSAEYNMYLSQRRAEAVERFLASEGVAPARIATRGYGLSSPLASNDTAAGRQQNRRVEIVILEPGASAEDSRR